MSARSCARIAASLIAAGAVLLGQAGALPGPAPAATSVAATVAAPAAAPTVPDPAAPAARTPARAERCPELLVLAVDDRGRGWQDGAELAPALGRFARPLQRKVARAGGSVAVRHLGVDFAPASRLVAGARGGERATRAVTRRNARAWRGRLGPVIRQLRDETHRLAGACPEQAFVLAGWSQGASAVHRALPALAADPALEGRLVGALLVADGDRSPGTRAELVGAPVAAASGSGVLTARFRPRPDVPAEGSRLLVASVCNAADLVCDLRGRRVRVALAAHHDYYDEAAGRRVLRQQAARFAERAAAWPRIVADQSLTARPGSPVSQQVAVRIGEDHAPGVVFEAVSGLPEGLALSADGLLSGELAETGEWPVTVRVRGTDPSTSWSTGTIQVVSTMTSVRSEVSAGGQTSCQVRRTGRGVCVGDNSWGQLGDGTDHHRSKPRRVSGDHRWATLDTSGATGCGITDEGRLYCWGMNTRSQLGIDGPQRWSPQPVDDRRGWTQVATGWLHTCALRDNGSLWCWGLGNHGQLGNGERSSARHPERVGRSRAWTSVAVGGWHTCATRSDGSAWCWGRNDFGQLGTDQTAARRLRPGRVEGEVAWTSLGASWGSTCGLTSTGEVRCWGRNDRGQLGDGSQTDRRVPGPVAGGGTWTTLAVGDSHACALDEAGAAWCWGGNRYGQLGTGTDRSSLVPVPVAGDRVWLDLDTGWMHTCGLAVDDRLECWGNNERGQLARGDRTDRSTPPGVPEVVLREAPRRADDEMVLLTFNVLGSNHTQPGGAALDYAPGRIRAEWIAQLLDRSAPAVVAFQEIRPDQYSALEKAVGDRYDFYPDHAGAGKVVWQTVMWDATQWELVEARDIWVPVVGSTRPNPLVLLRNRFTGQEIWVFNVHNSSKNTPERQRERNEAVRREIAEINAQRKAGYPVAFMGDMNERATVFCKVTGQTDLEAVTGGSHVGGKCRPPANMHLDWIFTSPEFGLRDHAFVRDAEVARITDHAILWARTSVPGS